MNNDKAAYIRYSFQQEEHIEYLSDNPEKKEFEEEKNTKNEIKILEKTEDIDQLDQTTTIPESTKIIDTPIEFNPEKTEEPALIPESEPTTELEPTEKETKKDPEMAEEEDKETVDKEILEKEPSFNITSVEKENPNTINNTGSKSNYVVYNKS
ncbi:hypothetical protein HZS_3525 [Henneguya salminicola]|nr:hypothetical protein HZS_3525 [Henneguya salminicola]